MTNIALNTGVDARTIKGITQRQDVAFSGYLPSDLRSEDVWSAGVENRDEEQSLKVPEWIDSEM